MKMLVTGATGYLGAVAADALATRGHQVLGLARSERSANTLRERGIEPVVGDFGDPASLANAVREARPDVVVSTASVGGASGDQAAFARDGEAVRAMREALTDHGGALIFTSGSAVFGVFLFESERFWSDNDSKPMKTPVHPASAMLRISDGSSVTSMVTAALQILFSGRSAAQSWCR